jgi:hypothetical protein
MKNKLIFGILWFVLNTIIGCRNNTPEEEILPKQLTSTNLDFRAYLSPDGKYIAFYTLRNSLIPNAAGMPFELWIMNRDGSNQRPLLKINELYVNTSIDYFIWSPDSKNIIVFLSASSIDYKSEIWQVTINGKKTKKQSSDYFLERPLYSPDGSKTSFIRQGPNPRDGSPVYRLYSANNNFSDTILIDTGLISDYDWINNSEGFVYSLYDQKTGNFDLWKSSINGNNKIKMAETNANEESLSCSSDGKYITYSDFKAIYITQSDAFSSKLIINNARLPHFVPNRNLILIYSNQSLDNKSWTEPWIIDTQGNIVRKIVEGESSEVTFSPSGNYIVYTIAGDIWLDYQTSNK